jgi:hypothetical protein
MSHLIIEKGKEVGKEVTVPPSGMKFGRSPANDLVLDDEAVMLFQGRFFFKTDGSLWATDFSGAEKTIVGGIPIDEHPLKTGDLVEVGSSAFRIINTKLEEPKEPDAQPAPSDEKVDLGFKPARGSHHVRPAKDHSKPSSLIYRVMQVAVILLILLVLAVAAPELIKRMGEPKTTKVVQKDGLSFVYERVMGSRENIFRYYLELTSDGKATIQIDDLANRHISKSVEISKKTMAGLSRRIEGTGFFELEEDRVGDVRGQHELYDLAIFRNGQFNQVRVLNREQPAAFKKTISILEDFVFGELDIPFTLLEEPEVLFGYAEDSFKLGEERFSEKDVRNGNLAAAIKHYSETVIYLETLEPKPDLYRQAVRQMQQAREIQAERYRDYMFNVDRAIRLADWSEASKHLRILAELIPDRTDERHEVISSKQLEVEEHHR